MSLEDLFKKFLYEDEGPEDEYPVYEEEGEGEDGEDEEEEYNGDDNNSSDGNDRERKRKKKDKDKDDDKGDKSNESDQSSGDKPDKKTDGQETEGKKQGPKEQQPSNAGEKNPAGKPGVEDATKNLENAAENAKATADGTKAAADATKVTAEGANAATGAAKAGADTAAGAGADTAAAMGTGAADAAVGGSTAAVGTGAADAAVGGSTAAVGTTAAADTAAVGTTTAVGGTTTAVGGTTTAVGGSSAAVGGGSAAGGAGLGSLIGATMPWSLIVILVIVIIIIIIIIISFFQTLPGAIFENLKTTIKGWLIGILNNGMELIGVQDVSVNVTKEQVTSLAQYINDMGYDIQTYGFGDIIVTKEDKDGDGREEIAYKNNRVDKTVEDDNASDAEVKSKYLKAYLAAEECTYHFRRFNWAKDWFGASAQEGLINVKDDGGLWDQYEDQLKIDRENESLVVYNRSLDLPIVGFFVKLFTGQRAIQWGEMFRYDLNTWIGRYKRPVELFLAIHLSTMMPDLTYEIATDEKFNTEVNVRFEPIKVCIRRDLVDNSAYIKINGEEIHVRDIIRDYLSCFEVAQGLFESDATFEDDKYEWDALAYSDNTPMTTLWDLFDTLYEKYDDIETILNDFWNWVCDFKYIKIKDSSQELWKKKTGIELSDSKVKSGNSDGDKTIRKEFFDEFGFTDTTFGHARGYDDEPSEFSLSDLEDLIDEFNENHEDDEDFEPIDKSKYTDSDKYYIISKSEWYKVRFKEDAKTERGQQQLALALILYKFGTEDLLAVDKAGIDNMLWPFVEDVKNHWYYNDIEFLGTTESNATYRLASVGYKTIDYKNKDDDTGQTISMQIPSALYPDTDQQWDFLVYQVAEPVTEGCNENIKKVFSGEYYRYDGTVQTAKMIANTRAMKEGKSKYYYNGEECDVSSKNEIAKQPVSMPESPETTLNSLAILKNMHSVASDYIYRDLKDLYVRMEYYSSEQMTEDLTLMWLWPIAVETKNQSFDIVETYDNFGKAIVANPDSDVLAPCDGKMQKVDGSTVRIKVESLNESAEKLLQYIFRNDYYRINKTKLNGLEVRLSGIKDIPSEYQNDEAHVTRGQNIGKINTTGQLAVTIRFEDKTVVEDMTEYMREDHNNVYERIMKERMDREDGHLPAIPLRDIFGGDAARATISTGDYDRNPSTVSSEGNARIIYETLKNNYNAEQIAGALGNLHYESGGLNTKNLQDTYASSWHTSDEEYTDMVNAGGHPVSGKNFVTDSGGYGIAQWTISERKQKLWNKAQQISPVDVSDINVQAGLLLEELADGSGWSNPYYRPNFDECGEGEDGVIEATVAFCRGFECPKHPEDSMQDRVNLALGYYQLIQSGQLGGSTTTNTTGSLVWPAPNTAKGTYSSGMEKRINPVDGTAEYHHGADIPGTTGDPIVSASNGVVCGNEYNSARGWYILVYDEGTHTKYVYQHMNGQSTLKIGDPVIAGQKIGEIGSTGTSTGPHLHFEIHENDSKNTSIPWSSARFAAGTVNPASFEYVDR